MPRSVRVLVSILIGVQLLRAAQDARGGDAWGAVLSLVAVLVFGYLAVATPAAADAGESRWRWVRVLLLAAIGLSLYNLLA